MLLQWKKGPSKCTHYPIAVDVFTNNYVPFSSHNYARHLQAQEEEHARQVQNRRELARAQHQEVLRMQEEARRLEKQQKKEKKKDCIIM